MSPEPHSVPYSSSNSRGSESAAAFRSERLRFRILLALVGSLAATAIVCGWKGWLTQENVRGLVARGGAFSPILYVCAATLLGMAWVPRWMLTAVAGALFGIGAGSMLGLVGGVGGALGGYWMGWRLGHDYLMHTAKGKGREVMEFVSRRGFVAILLGRVCPAISCQLVSVSSGVVGVAFSSFLGATILGMLPGSLLYAAFGASVLDPESRSTTLASLTGFGLLSVVAGVILWRLWRRDARCEVRPREPGSGEQRNIGPS